MMKKYPGIETKIMKNGNKAIMVRFKHHGVIYPVKNFTKLFGCKKERQAFEKLNEIKNLLTKNIDPFAKSSINLNDLFDNHKKINIKNKIWISDDTIKSKTYYYNKYIRDTIGKKKIEKITYEDIMNILNKFEHTQTSGKNRIITLLRPLFKEEQKKGYIINNVMDKVDKYQDKVKKEDLSKRTNHSYTDIVRNLYNAIPEYDQALENNIEQHQMFLYMVLLTAHRYNEINLLERKHCDLKNKKIIAPASITKTKVDYHFPIPDEVVSYIYSIKEGRLFNIPRGGTSSRIFHRLLRKANIETIGDHSISMHDTRKLMISIMVSKLGIDSKLADYCLEHKEQGTIKHYLEFTYEDKVAAYEKYWNYVRNEIIVNDKPIIDSMFEKGYLTKKQFEIEKDKLYF
jgi:integrase